MLHPQQQEVIGIVNNNFMSKRNFILIVIVLAIIVAVVFGFLYLYQPKTQTGDNSGGINFLADFLPFGKSKDTTPTDQTSPVDISGFEPSSNETQNMKLQKVSSFPIAGYGIYMKERLKEIQNPSQTLPEGEEGLIQPPPSGKAGGGLTEFTPALRYVNKTTGNVYQTFADKIDERIFSSTTIPKVYEAYFGNKGETVIMRYLKEGDQTIQTFVGALPKEDLGSDSVVANKLSGSFLPENISNVSVSPDTLKMFYLFNIENNAVGIVFSAQDNAKTQIFDSSFTEWLSFWANTKTITVTTKPSANVPGYMYAINPDRKDFNKILGGINGLTTLTSPDGKMVLYGNNNMSLYIFNTDTRESSLLGIKTLPEKCVWAPTNDIVYCAVPKFISQGQYPDSWYQGEVSFSDEIWKVDIFSGNTTMLLDPVSISGEDIDAIKLALDENQNYLFFVNKKDSYLWKLEIK